MNTPSNLDHPVRHRADLARRAVLRHLLAAPQRAHHLPRHADRRQRREPDRRADDPPRVRGPGQGHQHLHQLAGRLGVCRASRSTTRCRFIKPDVATTCVGIAMSMGALLLAAGAEGKRTALPNSKILIHQVSGGFQGQGTDIEIQARETINLKRAPGGDHRPAHESADGEGLEGHGARLLHERRRGPGSTGSSTRSSLTGRRNGRTEVQGD